MSAFHRLSPLAFFLLLAACALASPVRAQDGPDPADRARTLRVLTLLRPDATLMPATGTPGMPLRPVRAGTGTGAIAGTLSDLDPEGLATASVTAWTADSTDGRVGFGIAKVMPDGTYRIDGLDAGDYYVMASANGYVPAFYDGAADLSDARTVAVADTGTVAGIDFVLARHVPGGGSIAGTVRAADDGRPVPMAVVYVFAPENPFLYGRAATGPDGTYVVAGLKAGRYVVEVQAEGFLPVFFDDAATLDAATPVEVAGTGRTEGIDFRLAAGGSIAGYVRNADGVPVGGAYVQAVSALALDSIRAEGGGGRGGWAVSGPDGAYRVGGLGTGSYYVSAQATTHWTFAYQWYDRAATLEAAVLVPVTAGDETGGVDFALALPAARSSLAGRVTDGDGHPVAEAIVTVQHVPPPSGAEPDAPYVDAPYVWAYAVTDADGRYAVEDLPAGRYLVSAARQYGWEYVQRWYRDADTPEAATPVTVGESERVGDVDVVLPLRAGTASLAGVVRNVAGNGLAGAFVAVSPAEEAGGTVRNLWAYATADSTGAYRVDRLPAGTYVVHASYGTGDAFGQGWYDGARDRADATPVVLADEVVRTGIDFALTVRPWYGSVAGTVTDAATGAPVARAYVELSPFARDLARCGVELSRCAAFRFPFLYAVTGEDGRFRIDYVPEGAHALAVYADGAAVLPGGTEPLEVIGGEVATADVALTAHADGDGVVAGTVTAEDGQWDSTFVGPEKWGTAPVFRGTAAKTALDGTPLDVAVVVAFPVDGPEGVGYAAVTAKDGTYRLRGLASGDYVVRGFAPGYVGAFYDGTYSPDRATPVTVADGQPVSGVDFALAPAYYLWMRGGGIAAGNTVAGRVTTGQGAPVAGAAVYLLDEAEQPVASVQTGPDGRYELAGVVPGRYRLYAGKVGHSGRYNGNARAFEAAEPIALSGGYLEVDLVLDAGTATGTDDEPGVPRVLALEANYPNPFNPSTHFAFAVPTTGRAAVRVFDVLGREVALLFDGTAEAGRRYTLDFHAATLATGVYLYTLEHDGQRLARTMILAK